MASRIRLQKEEKARQELRDARLALQWAVTDAEKAAAKRRLWDAEMEMEAWDAAKDRVPGYEF